MTPAWIIFASLGISGPGQAQAPTPLAEPAAGHMQGHFRAAPLTFFQVAAGNAGPYARGICITPVRYLQLAAERGGAEANRREQGRGNGPSPLPVCGPSPGPIQPV